MQQLSKTILPALSLIGVVVAAAGCANPTARVAVMRPAPINLSAYELIAVDNFEGTPDNDSGSAFSAELADALRQAENPVTGQVEYEIISASEVESTVDNLRVGRGTELDPRSMEVLKRWRSADVLIRGTILEYDVEDDVQQFEKTDRKGNVTVERVRQVTARVSLEIETTKPGTTGDQTFDRITLGDTVTQTRRSRSGTPPRVDYGPLLATARQRVVQQYLARVLPRTEYVQVALRTASQLPDLEIGNGYAQAGDWEGATKAYEQAQQVASESADIPPGARAAALYNLGLAYGFSNRFEEARQLLRDSYALDRNKSTLAELNNVDRRESDFLELQAQSEEVASPSR